MPRGNTVLGCHKSLFTFLPININLVLCVFLFKDTLFSMYIVHSLINIEFMANSTVQFSRSIVSDSLQPHEPQHARPPCPSPTPGVHPNPYIQFWHHLLQRLCPFQLITFTRLSEINYLTCVGLLFVLSILPH